jgi:ABC-type polysaccharide/polyol phosphate transport system ATPase subunit
MSAVIEVDAVAKSFWIPSVRRETIREHAFALFRPRRFERLDVLEQVSFDVRAGETFGIMGRNGSGKSTLLKILCGIYPPDRGAVRRHADITPILELGVGWNPELDAIDNIYLLGSVMGLSLPELKSGLEEILAFSELERFANLELKHYSSGMASRLAYAVAFHAVREVLILDEIFAVGDVGFKNKCADRHRSLKDAGCTTILVSHDPGVIAAHCDRAVLLEHGRIDFEGPLDEVVSRYVAATQAS